jgi:hypothetical protein
VSYAFVDPAGNYPAYYLDVADSAAAAWGANLEQDAPGLPAGGTSPLPASFANGVGIENASSTLWARSNSITGMAAANGATGLRMAGLAASFGETYTGSGSYFDMLSLAPHTSLTVGFDLSMLLHQRGQCNAGQCDAAFAEIIVGYSSTPDNDDNSEKRHLGAERPHRGWHLGLARRHRALRVLRRRRPHQLRKQRAPRVRADQYRRHGRQLQSLRRHPCRRAGRVFGSGARGLAAVGDRIAAAGAAPAAAA